MDGGEKEGAAVCVRVKRRIARTHACTRRLEEAEPREATFVFQVARASIAE